MPGKLYVLNDIESAICTRPNLHQFMSRATQATGAVGFSLQEVDPRAGKARIKVGGNVRPDRLREYLSHLGEDLGITIPELNELPRHHLQVVPTSG